MSADRYNVAAGNTGKYDQDAVVIDRVTGCVVERFPGDGGNATQRARRFAAIMNKAAAAGPIPEIERRNWDRRDDAWVAYVECDQELPREDGCGLLRRVVINGKIRECVDVESTQLARPIRAGEPIGLLLR